MTRGVSTVLDAAVFLLLVSAAAATVALPPAAPPQPPVADPAGTVRTATASVEYSLAPGVRQADPSSPVRFAGSDGPEFTRTAHGGLAGLLADAAVRNLTVDGVQVTHASDDFETAVATAVANATVPRTHAVATWTPYPGAPVRGRVAAGREPPSDADVVSETFVVPSGGREIRAKAIRVAETRGYAGVAQVAARAVVRLALPADRLRVALYGDYPVDALAAHRFWRVGHLLGVESHVTPETVEAVNGRLTGALATRFERDMRQRFATPGAAASALDVAGVDVVVRRWRR